LYDISWHCWGGEDSVVMLCAAVSMGHTLEDLNTSNYCFPSHRPYTVRMYQQHILSLHPVWIHHTTVDIYCISSQLHLHLYIVLGHYISFGHLLHNSYSHLYQDSEYFWRLGITFLIPDTLHCLPLQPIFCTHGCHNNSRLLTVALLYIPQHNTPHYLFTLHSAAHHTTLPLHFTLLSTTHHTSS